MADTDDLLMITEWIVTDGVAYTKTLSLTWSLNVDCCLINYDRFNDWDPNELLYTIFGPAHTRDLENYV